MCNTTADRHRREAAGLVPLDPTRAVRVRIIVEADHAASRASQHTAWMLVNMLARLELVVARVEIACPTDVPLQHHVVPLATDAGGLAATLVAGGLAIGVVPVGQASDTQPADLTLVVGPGPARPDATRVFGAGWTGACSTAAALPAPTARSALPFGPYVAATLGVSEVFRTVRGDPDRYRPIGTVVYSAYSHRVEQAWFEDGPATVQGLAMSVDLAGAGAVGCAWLHTVWATDDVEATVQIADDDDAGVDASNLNRDTLFTVADLGAHKATVAAAAAGREGLHLTPFDGKVETAAPQPGFMVVAADSNAARASIQSTYPFPLLFASTSDLRAEVVRCDPTAGGPCMRCHNPPASTSSDDELASRYLGLSEDQRTRMAHSADVSVEHATAWAQEPTCGVAGARVLTALRTVDDHERALFAVPFVSVLAGVLLAAETIKEVAGLPPLHAGLPRAVFQFLHPAAESNGTRAYGRDASCPQCDPDSPGGRLWLDKARQSNARPAD